MKWTEWEYKTGYRARFLSFNFRGYDVDLKIVDNHVRLNFAKRTIEFIWTSNSKPGLQHSFGLYPTKGVTRKDMYKELFKNLRISILYGCSMKYRAVWGRMNSAKYGGIASYSPHNVKQVTGRYQK